MRKNLAIWIRKYFCFFSFNIRIFILAVPLDRPEEHNTEYVKWMSFSFRSEKKPARWVLKHNRGCCFMQHAYKTATSTGWGSFSKALDLGKFTEINQNADQTSRVKAYNHQLVSEYNIWQNQTRVAFVWAAL